MSIYKKELLFVRLLAHNGPAVCISKRCRVNQTSLQKISERARLQGGEEEA